MKAKFEIENISKLILNELHKNNLAEENIESLLLKCLYIATGELLFDNQWFYINSDNGIEIEIPDDVLMYGTCVEYCLIVGEFDKASEYCKKQRKILKGIKK